MAVLAVYAGWNWAYTEQARYWRRNVLTGDDFNGDFLKYLLFNEAFQKDLLWWLLLVLLQAAAMAGAVWLQPSCRQHRRLSPAACPNRRCRSTITTGTNLAGIL